VTERSDALDLERGVFTQKDPKRIAVSLKRSAEGRRRRCSAPRTSCAASSAGHSRHYSIFLRGS
jgi:hypothetical protein